MSSSRTNNKVASRLRTARLRVTEEWKAHERIARKRQRIGRIRLTTPWFQATWVAFFALRGVLFLFLAGLSVGYWFMSSAIFVTTRKAYNLPGPTAMLVISSLFGFSAVVCGFHLVQMVRCSIQQQRLAFRSQAPASSVSMTSSSPHDHLARVSTPQTLWSHARALYRSVFSSRGLLGIEHPFFFQLLVLREGLEIASQGYQAYLSSTLVPRRWPNDLAATLLALNCWSTLLVDALGPKSLVARRVLCLAVDIVLDFAWSVLIPACLLVPYIAAYDPVVRAFPEHLQVDFVWMLSWQMEIQQLCLTSWVDVISSMMPFVSILMSTRTITGLVDEKRTLVMPGRDLQPPSLCTQDALRHIDTSAGETLSLIAVASTAPARTASARSSRVATKSGALCSRISKARAGNSRAEATAKRSCASVGLHVGVFFIIGVAVIGVHVYAVAVANRLNADAGCLVQLRPWFTNEYACAYANLNCYAGRTGDPNHRNAAAVSDGDDVAERLAAFQPATLLYLVISHAPALAMPVAVASFSNLRMLMIYNSTILGWPNSAALTTETHAHLRQLSLVRANVSALPDALTQRAPFVIVDLIATNLTTLPDSVSANWHALQYFAMEHGRLRALPPGIAAMRMLERLSVCDNEIDELPSVLPGKYAAVNVARNPLRALPMSVHDTSALRLFTFERTLVAQLPQWVTDTIAARGSQLVVTGQGSAFCDTSSAPGVRCDQPSRYVNGQFLLAHLSSFLDLPSL